MSKSQAQIYKEAEVQATYDKHRNTDGNTQFAASFIEAGLGYVAYEDVYVCGECKLSEAEYDQLQAKFDALPCFKPKSSKTLESHIAEIEEDMAKYKNTARPQFDDVSAYPVKTALVSTLPNPRPSV